MVVVGLRQLFVCSSKYAKLIDDFVFCCYSSDYVNFVHFYQDFSNFWKKIYQTKTVTETITNMTETLAVWYVVTAQQQPQPQQQNNHNCSSVETK